MSPNQNQMLYTMGPKPNYMYIYNYRLDLVKNQKSYRIDLKSKSDIQMGLKSRLYITHNSPK